MSPDEVMAEEIGYDEVFFLLVKNRLDITQLYQSSVDDATKAL